MGRAQTTNAGPGMGAVRVLHLHLCLAGRGACREMFAHRVAHLVGRVRSVLGTRQSVCDTHVRAPVASAPRHIPVSLVARLAETTASVFSSLRTASWCNARE